MTDLEEKQAEDVKEDGIDNLFSKLNDVIQNLEKEDVSLEDSFAYYHKGMELLKICNEKIDRVEKQIQVLDDEGNVHEF